MCIPSSFSLFSTVFLKTFSLELQSPIAQSARLENRSSRSLFLSLARPIFLSRIDDSHCDRIHSSLTDFHCFHKKLLVCGKAASGLERVEYWLKELQESVDRITVAATIYIVTERLLNGVKHDKIIFHFTEKNSCFNRHLCMMFNHLPHS